MRNPLRRPASLASVAGRARAHVASSPACWWRPCRSRSPGSAGVVTRDAADHLQHLSVPQLGQLPVRSELLDTHGQVIAYYYPANIYRIPVNYAQISPDMRNAIVAIEDDRFYQHGALDPRGTFRALVNDVNNESVQGGSTLAQQYVKNALILTSQSTEAKEDAAADTPARKIRELRIAANVVHELSTQQILAGYLNVAYFGTTPTASRSPPRATSRPTRPT